MMNNCEHEFETTSAVMGEHCWKCDLTYVEFLKSKIHKLEEKVAELQERIDGMDGY